MDQEGVYLLLEQQISVQHRHYPTHDEAMRDFQLINNGTRLTPYELCQGFLKYMPGYRDCWSAFLAELGGSLENSEHRLRAKIRNGGRQDREQEHKRRRNTLALFHRFLTGETQHSAYLDVSANNVQRFVDSKQAIELLLRDALLVAGYEKATQALISFRRFVDLETAFIEEIMREELGPGSALSAVAHRWLLDLAVWRHNNKRSRDDHDAFVRKFLKATKGSSQWINDGKGNTLSLSHLGLLPRLSTFAEMPECWMNGQRRRRGQQMLPGYDSSHIEPFVTHGDGPTFPESAPRNRSRGARPVAVRT
jgi:hypothetical protein